MSNRGSEWRKWDLHFHTPSSGDYKVKNIPDETIFNQKIIDTLVENEIAVVAITDHHIMDVERIKELQNLGKDKVTILPAIEFCSELGGSKSVHFIGIFSENSDIDYIWGQLSNNTNVKYTLNESKKKEEIYCDLEDTCKLIHELKGITTIHGGTKGNSFECIKGYIHKLNQKSELLNRYIDIIEVGKTEDITSYKETIFQSIKKSIPMVICSDNHNINKYEVKENCWIKADATFEGLKQVIYEPTERVKIQKENPNLDFNKPCFTEINIANSINTYGDNRLYFEKQSIPLNSSLVAIIGGRGSGKSTLIDYIAHGLNDVESGNKYQLSEHFQLKRKKGINEQEDTHILSEKHSVPILYISQSKIKKLVDDKIQLSNDIKKTIGINNNFILDDDINIKINDVLNRYKEYYDFLEDEYNDISKIEKEIKEKEDFITNISTPETQTAISLYKELSEELDSLDSRKIKIIGFITHLSTQELDLNKTILSLNEENNINTPTISFEPQISILDKKVTEIIENIKTKETEKENTYTQFKDYKGDIFSLLDNVSIYQEELKQLKQQQEKIKDINDKMEKLKTTDIVNIFESILNLVDTYIIKINEQWKKFKNGKDEWSELQKAVLSKILSDNQIKIIGNIKFDEEKFYQNLLSNLDGRSYNKNNLKKHLHVETIEDFINLTKTYEMLNEKIFNLEFFYGHNVYDVLKVLLKDFLEYIQVNAEAKYQDKDISKLSVGQQGTLYLRLKLASDLFSTPLIYDQPEDDLDNEFIMQELVDIFKLIKRYRQVIIVTHNANLVVNADAEQIIVAKNEENTLTYCSGSLENTEINKDICRILEGGEQAFNNRRKKYGINS